MTKQTEALKLALEALEVNRPASIMGTDQEWSIWRNQRFNAIRACQETLAESAMQQLTDVSQEIEAALAQSEQEPLADFVVGCFDAAAAEGLAEVLAETTDERLKDLVERRLMYAYHAASTAPQPQQDVSLIDEGKTQQEPVAWLDEVMSQAQVFASAWSLVGSRFDDGGAMDEAEQAKRELRSMLAAPQPRAMVPLTDKQKLDIVTNWFTDECDITRAMQMLIDFEQTSPAN